MFRRVAGHESKQVCPQSPGTTTIWILITCVESVSGYHAFNTVVVALVINTRRQIATVPHVVIDHHWHNPKLSGYKHHVCGAPPVVV